MAQQVTAADLIPPRPSLTKLRDIAADCRACDLWQCGTQTVFGEGKKGSEIMFVGEQPGDQEDKQGRPFVGPAGRVLGEALDEAGIDRDAAYVTNIVKHFKWVARGKRRIHKKPSAGQVNSCKPWLEAEIDVVKPRAIVCLGATAAQGLLGRDFRVTQSRGEPVESDLAPLVIATIHPSSILRVRDSEERKLEMKHFTEDLAQVARLMKNL